MTTTAIAAEDNQLAKSPQLPGTGFLYGATNWLLFLAGTSNLFVGTISAARGSAPLAATCLTAGLVLLFAATIDRFELLQGLGMKAQTRKLDEKLEEASDALQRLRELAELAGSALIDLNSRSGRWVSPPSPGDQYAFGQSVKLTLEALGCNAAVINGRLAPWARVMCQDLAFALTDDLRDALKTKLGNIAQYLAAKTRQPISPTDTGYLGAIAESTAVNEHLQRLNGIGQFRLEDFPDAFLRLFGNVPLLAETIVGPTRAKAQSFADSMRALRETMTIPDAQSWFVEIEASRDRANPVGGAMARSLSATEAKAAKS